MANLDITLYCSTNFHANFLVQEENVAKGLWARTPRPHSLHCCPTETCRKQTGRSM